MGSHVEQVPPLQMPEPGGFIGTAFQLMLARERQVSLPLQTAPATSHQSAREKPATSSSASKPSQKARPAAPTHNVPTGFERAPSGQLHLEARPKMLSSLHDLSPLKMHQWLQPHTPQTQFCRHLPQRRRPSRRPCPRGSSRWSPSSC